MDSKQTITIKGIIYDVCPCCGKPKRGTGKTQGGVLGIVVKNYVKDGKVIDLVGNMERLLVAVGYEYLERIHALLVKSSYLGTDIWSGDETYKITERKSFFRRHQEKRNPSAKINEEAIIFVRKPR